MRDAPGIPDPKKPGSTRGGPGELPESQIRGGPGAPGEARSRDPAGKEEGDKAARYGESDGWPGEVLNNLSRSGLSRVV